ncbi:MAG TPA: hypothetical protein DCS30_12485 [Rhizobiales bacterium]|nr:hypothetical protein [Hyphomicrobiales bacterium]
MTNQILPPDGHIDKTNLQEQGYPFALEFNPDDYRHHLNESGLSQAEADEFLATLWNIMVSFVDLGFGIEATQQVIAENILNDLNKKGEDICN